MVDVPFTLSRVAIQVEWDSVLWICGKVLGVQLAQMNSANICD
jgi:hypothetical protein